MVLVLDHLILLGDPHIHPRPIFVWLVSCQFSKVSHRKMPKTLCKLGGCFSSAVLHCDG